jgi:hypothetical protein
MGLYLGGYMNVLLNKELSDDAPSDTDSSPRLGILLGVDTAIKAGPGAVLVDFRASMDLEGTGFDALSYERIFLSLAVGYKVGFIKRRPPSPR